MKFIRKYWISVILGLVSYFVFSFKLQPSTSFEADLGRDLFEIAKISFGNFTLLGPKGSFGGIYTAPYHYYMFLLPFIFVGRQLNGILFFNVLLFSLSLVFFSFHVSKQFGKLSGFLSGLVLMLLPFFIFSARNPGNGFTPTAFFLFFLTVVYFYDINKFVLIKIFLLGFLFGFILSMLFAYVTIFVPILLFVYLLLKKKKVFLFFLLGIFLAFSPLIIFEFKNHFVMLKNTFIDKSYSSFVNNANLPNGIKLNKNIFTNTLDLIKKMQPYLGINIYLAIFFLLSSFVWIKKYKERLLILITSIGFAILILILRFQYADHYLFPFLTLISFCLLIIISQIKLKIFLLTTSIIFLLITFPKNYYTKSTRTYSLIKKRVEKTLGKKLISKSDKFNVILKRYDNALTPAGNEYRLFFLLNGYEPQSEFSYKDSPKLIIFSENNTIDFKKFDSWEINEFEISKTKKFQLFKPDPEMIVYMLEK